jgi:hypothetical protein
MAKCSNPYLIKELLNEYISKENYELVRLLSDRNKTIANLIEQIAVLQEENMILSTQTHVLEDHYGNQTIFQRNTEGVFEEIGYINQEERPEIIARRLNFDTASDDESVETNEMFEFEI